MRNHLSRIFFARKFSASEFHNHVRLYIKVRVQRPLRLEDNSGDKAIVKSGTKRRTSASTSDVYSAKKNTFLSNTGKALLDEVSAAGIMNFPAQINVPLGKRL